MTELKDFKNKDEYFKLFDKVINTGGLIVNINRTLSKTVISYKFLFDFKYNSEDSTVSYKTFHFKNGLGKVYRYEVFTKPLNLFLVLHFHRAEFFVIDGEMFREKIGLIGFPKISFNLKNRIRFLFNRVLLDITNGLKGKCLKEYGLVIQDTNEALMDLCFLCNSGADVSDYYLVEYKERDKSLWIRYGFYNPKSENKDIDCNKVYFNKSYEFVFGEELNSVKYFNFDGNLRYFIIGMEYFINEPFNRPRYSCLLPKRLHPNLDKILDKYFKDISCGLLNSEVINELILDK